jgi:hypothetical protein
MTTEKKLRDYARAVVSAERLRDDAVVREDFPELTEREFERLCDLVALWPVLDLPVPDRNGCLWPLHGYNFGHVQRRGDRIIIRRGDNPMHLTKGEALELAAILTAAAMEEA